MRRTIALALQLALALPLAALQPPRLVKDGPPVDPTGVQELVSAHGARIRYKQPGRQGVCQTTVDDYAGYISLDEKYASLGTPLLAGCMARTLGSDTQN